MKFDVLDQGGETLFSYSGSLKAGDQVYLGADIGLSIAFAAGTLTSNQTAATTVSQTPTDVDPTPPSTTRTRPAAALRERRAGRRGFVHGQRRSIAVIANDSINTVLARINASVAA